MTGETTPPSKNEWPGQPLPKRRAPRNTVVIARSILRRLRAAVDLCSPLNIGKGFRRLARGEITLMASSIRNLIAQRIALVQMAQPIGIERFTPLPDTPGVPLVSIIIPCFNDGRYVGEAVASALAQTFRDIEIIVVDGGSTDGTTPAIVAALESPRVRVLIRTDGRHYVGDNRNFGIADTKSRYICCLDSDDRLEPTYIEKVLFQLEYRAYDVGSSSMRMFGAEQGEWRVPEQPVVDDFAWATKCWSVPCSAGHCGNSLAAIRIRASGANWLRRIGISGSAWRRVAPGSAMRGVNCC